MIIWLILRVVLLHNIHSFPMTETIKSKWYYQLLAAPLLLLMMLPLSLLYLLSDMLYYIMYYMIGYRKKVVYTNLHNAFPDKSAAEIDAIAKKYYRYLIDLMIETYKVVNLSKRELKRRCTYDEASVQLIDSFYQNNQSVIMVLGHWGNWEWGGHSFMMHHPYPSYVLYHPIKNPFFNWLTAKIRMRFGMNLLNMHLAAKKMIALRKQRTITAFIADQTPSNPKDALWLTFLSQPTPVLTGAEFMAKKLNFPVAYASVKRLRRGYYHVSFKLVTDNPAATSENEITEKYTRLLEQDIISCPETWLWSHRRWKHNPPTSGAAEK